MRPILFTFNKINIYAYGVFLLSGILFAILLFLLEVRRKNLDVQIGINLCLWSFITALILSKVNIILFSNRDYSYTLIYFRTIFSEGYSTKIILLGSMLGTLIYIYVKKLDFWIWADLGAPSIAIGQAISRIGCLFAGCCYGIPTKVFWGITFKKSLVAPLDVNLHPTQIYYIISNLLIFTILFLRRNKKIFTGELILIYILFYSSSRLTLDFFRGDVSRNLFNETITMTQFIGIIAIVSSLVLYFLRMKVTRK